MSVESPGAGGYGAYRSPHDGVMPTATLAADYAHLAATTRANDGVGYYVRYEQAGQAGYGVLEGDTIHQLSTHFFADPVRTGRTAALAEVRLLAPLDGTRVSKVLGVALNTPGPDLAVVPPHWHPRWFTKLPTSITGPGAGIEVPEEASLFIHEAELVLVIGRRGRHLTVEDAGRHIWGVTAGNDLTEFAWFTGAPSREIPPGQAGKMADTFAPIGPAIAVGLDYSDLHITHRLNGAVTQSGSTADRLQRPAELVAHVSRYVTLLPGDLIFTGATPFAPGARKAVQPGDELAVEIERIGILRNLAVPMGGVRWEGRWPPVSRPTGSKSARQSRGAQ